MPLDRLILILIIVIGAGMVTVWLGAVVAAGFAIPMAWVSLVPMALVAYVGWRVLADRLGSKDDDHYDGMQ